MTTPLQDFVAPLTGQLPEVYHWPGASFAVQSYLHPLLPPVDFITSVRVVVLRQGEVLVVQDPNGQHILPGGRREAGESLAETATREVAEETGWQVSMGPLLGFKHFTYLTPPTGRAPYPAFVQIVYVASAVAYRPEAREQDGYELGAEFMPLAQVAVTASEQLFLAAALAAHPRIREENNANV
ncbi:MAG: NUDIX domain-containing protein [Caldilineaceae bacterium]|nr:NUDIX domain-containing protein [Caldilineaceae bacterium]